MSFSYCSSTTTYKIFCANMIPTPRAVRIIGNTSIMRNQQLQQRRHRHKILSQRNLAAVVQNHTAIQGSKRGRPDTFSTAGSSTNQPRTAAISSPSASAIIAGCTTDLSDTCDISLVPQHLIKSQVAHLTLAGCASHDMIISSIHSIFMFICCNIYDSF